VNLQRHGGDDKAGEGEKGEEIAHGFSGDEGNRLPNRFYPIERGGGDVSAAEAGASTALG
jgi:hypothetical protein